MARDDDDFDRDRDDWEPEPEPDPRAAGRRAKPPAIALMVVGVLSLGYLGWDVYQFYFSLKQEIADHRQRVLSDSAADPQKQQTDTQILDLTEQALNVLFPISWGVQGLAALLMIGGAVPLLRGKGRGWGLAAASAAVFPHLGCLVWVASLTVGIWALIVLNNRDVKRAFAANKLPAPDR